MDYEDKPEGEDWPLELIELAARDVAAVSAALRQLIEHFGLELDEERSLPEICRLAGYLQECADLGKPVDILAAIEEFFEHNLKTKLSRYHFQKQNRAVHSMN